MASRVIGTFGGEKPGALVICIGALHGNEPAGVHALEMVFQQLAVNPELEFNGRFLGLIGNLGAYSSGIRYVRQDFNRIWFVDRLQQILRRRKSRLQAEDKELAELFEIIHHEIEAYKPDRIFFLDLHTTSANGGIFSIPTGEGPSLQWAKSLQAPVILDLFKEVDGTLLRFARNGHFVSGGIPIQTLGVAFEAGQHEDFLAVSRAMLAIINTLTFAGCVEKGSLESPNEQELKESAAALPKVTRIIYAHHIEEDDNFKMRPGYRNFQPIEAGEHLADDATGPIRSNYNSLILMPLYQPKGSDGFFLVKEEE
ncbi:MAG: succinylglutamate desuccinylase/aspartoacylase family protein [Saprospiraceae bacterium]